ncbi:MAG: ABC transporter substrate-binding protein [Clostridia bacterium]|nr:ABC transporter substrate-binding protein [Clostridia bacterium]
MKKTLVSLVASLTLLSVLLCFATGCSSGGITGCFDDREVLNVYNWGEYISDGEDDSLDVIEAFEEKYNIRVNYTTFASNEEMYQKIKSGAGNYDVIIPSDYMVEKMINEGLLEKLDFDNIPNYKYIGSDYKDLDYDPNNEYSVPYLWGTVGIFYNSTMVDEEDVEAQSWDLLWNKKYSGQILMFDNPRDAFGIAMKKLGYSQNSTNEDEWEEAYELLAEQKPLVQAYVMDQIFDKMANEEAAIAPYYAGDARIMSAENPDIKFYLPVEGSNKFFDAMCIVKGTEHKEAAEKFIDFMCEADVALANSEYVCYSTPHTEAYKMLDKDVRNNKNYYPDSKVLDRCEVFCNLPADINELENDLWIKLKTK